MFYYFYYLKDITIQKSTHNTNNILVLRMYSFKLVKVSIKFQNRTIAVWTHFLCWAKPCSPAGNCPWRAQCSLKRPISTCIYKLLTNTILNSELVFFLLLSTLLSSKIFFTFLRSLTESLLSYILIISSVLLVISSFISTFL